MASSIQLNFIKKFSGYFNYRDITNLLPNALTVGSQNMFVLDGVKIATRGGMDYLGAPGTIGTNINPSWTVAHRIHSHYDTFTNNQGLIMPFRVYYSGSTLGGDIVDTWLPIYVGGVAQTAKKWYQVNANAPSQPIISTHKWYWSEWFDSVNNINRIVFTYGQQTVGSYTGAYAPIVNITPTTLQTVPGTSWEDFGFVNAPEGVNSIVINVSGVPTEIPLASGDFSTDTITIASTTGIVLDDLAFQAFNSDTIDVQAVPTGFNADICRSLGNQVYYFDWKQRNVLLSWAFNQTAFNTEVVYQGSSGLNDAVFSGIYTDLQTDTFQVTIDSVNPSINIQTFTPGAPIGGYDNMNIDTSGYVGGIGITNVYNIVIIADMTLLFTVASGLSIGQSVTGNTSGATGFVVAEYMPGGGGDVVGIRLTSPIGFIDGETLAVSDGSTSPVISTANQFYWFQYVINGSVTLVDVGAGPQLANVLIALPINLTDGLILNSSVYGHGVGDTLTLTIKTGSPDTFSWSLNGVTQASLIPCSTTPTLLADGVSVNFINTTGHNIGDNWRVVYYPTIIKGWRQTYYTGYGNAPGTTPATNKGSIRLAGEGFKMQLDSNAWAAEVQENVMYINGSGGEYYTVLEQFSNNNQTQLYNVQRLKTAPQKKAIYPYQMVSEPNYLAIVSVEKTWDVLGRQKFIELPQLKTYSDFVKYDFLNANWLNSEQTYFDRKQWFILPEDGQVFCYDDFMKYWHPPQSFGRRIGSLVIIDGQTCAHSYERNETYQVFTNDLNDLGLYPLNTHFVLSYYDLNKRFNIKTTQAIAFDGYMEGNPQINWRINGGVAGCKYQKSGVISPIYCYPPDEASLGKSQYGYHGLGNSPQTIIPHFVYGKTFNEENAYLRNIEGWSDSFEQNWTITSIGELTKYDLSTNSDIFNPDDNISNL